MTLQHCGCSYPATKQFRLELADRHRFQPELGLLDHNPVLALHDVIDRSVAEIESVDLRCQVDL